MGFCFGSAVSLHPTFSTGATDPFSRDILMPLAGSLSCVQEGFKVSPTAEEVAELPCGFWTQE